VDDFETQVGEAAGNPVHPGRENRQLRVDQVDRHRAAQQALVPMDQLPTLDHRGAIGDPRNDIAVSSVDDGEISLARQDNADGRIAGRTRDRRDVADEDWTDPHLTPEPRRSRTRRIRGDEPSPVMESPSLETMAADGLVAPGSSSRRWLWYARYREDEHRAREDVSIHDGASTEPGRSRPRGRDGSAGAAGHREATRASRRGERWLPR
jgi:hypothetical protein